MSKARILVIGYGNPGRLDDGLGPAFAEEIEALQLPGVTVDSDYQLNIEDSDAIARHETVVFADASVDCAEPFDFQPLEPKHTRISFSSHSITPDALLGLAIELFKCKPKAYMMAIRGYEYNEFGERLSEQAKTNLVAAVDFFVEWVRRANTDHK